MQGAESTHYNRSPPGSPSTRSDSGTARAAPLYSYESQMQRATRTAGPPGFHHGHTPGSSLSRPYSGSNTARAYLNTNIDDNVYTQSLRSQLDGFRILSQRPADSSNSASGSSSGFGATLSSSVAPHSVGVRPFVHQEHRLSNSESRLQEATPPIAPPSETGRRPLLRTTTGQHKYVDLMMKEIAELRATVTDLTQQVKNNEDKASAVKDQGRLSF